MKADDEHEVQDHVYHARDRQKVQRAAGIAHRAQHRRAKVVEHVEGHAEEVDADVLRGQRQHVVRGAHPSQKCAAEDEAEHAHDHAADEADGDGGVHGLLRVFEVARAVIVGGDDVRADREPQKHVDDQIDQRAGGAHRRQRLLAREAADHDHVRGVVEQLKDARQHQRQRERRHLRNQFSVGHIQLIAVFCPVQSNTLL